MSKQLQILLAVIISVSILAGFLLDHMLIGSPDPVKPGPTPTPDASIRTGRKISFPQPRDPQDRSEYLQAGRQIFFNKGCWNCHKMGTEELPGAISLTAQGPDLAEVGRRLSGEEIFESIVNPSAVIADPREKYSTGDISKMPSSVGNLSADDLLKLTAFLMSRTSADAPATPLVLPDSRTPPPSATPPAAPVPDLPPATPPPSATPSRSTTPSPTQDVAPPPLSHTP